MATPFFTPLKIRVPVPVSRFRSAGAALHSASTQEAWPSMRTPMGALPRASGPTRSTSLESGSMVSRYLFSVNSSSRPPSELSTAVNRGVRTVTGVPSAGAKAGLATSGVGTLPSASGKFAGSVDEGTCPAVSAGLDLSGLLNGRRSLFVLGKDELPQKNDGKGQGHSQEDTFLFHDSALFCRLGGRSGRDGIISARAEGVAAGKPLEREKSAPKHAMGLHGLQGVLRAGGLKPAATGKQGRQKKLVEPYEGNAYRAHGRSMME